MKIRTLLVAFYMAALPVAAAQAAQSPQSQERSTEEQKTMPPRSATASTAAATSRETFGSLDKDKDGRVSSTEAGVDAGFDAGFAAMDANGDGFVSDVEYRAHAKARGKMEDEQPSQPM